jgi:hypothetical protein
MVVATTHKKVSSLLGILFNEMKLWQAHLFIKLNNGEFETYSIDCMAWAQDKNEYLPYHLASYQIGGVRFEKEDQARQFLEKLEKRLMWQRLGGKWA